MGMHDGHVSFGVPGHEAICACDHPRRVGSMTNRLPCTQTGMTARHKNLRTVVGFWGSRTRPGGSLFRQAGNATNLMAGYN